MTQLPEGMPELPEGDVDTPAFNEAWTREQVEAFGLACYQAGMERAAKVCDKVQSSNDERYGWDSGYRVAAEECAATIRAAKPK